MTTVEVGYDGSDAPAFLPGFGKVEVSREIVPIDSDALTGVRVHSSPGVSADYEISTPVESLLERNIGAFVIRPLGGKTEELAVSIRKNGFELTDKAIGAIAIDALAQNNTTAALED
ncbi:MAG: hypothetical protein ACREF5_01800 [Candidatus Saccharimonadales bacterium]